MVIVRRQDAIKQGLKRYFTGKPCSNNASKKNSFTPYYQGMYGWAKSVLEQQPITFEQFRVYVEKFEEGNS